MSVELIDIGVNVLFVMQTESTTINTAMDLLCCIYDWKQPTIGGLLVGKHPDCLQQNAV